jgi:hypothetical protein
LGKRRGARTELKALTALLRGEKKKRNQQQAEKGRSIRKREPGQCGTQLKEECFKEEEVTSCMKSNDSSGKMKTEN